MITCLIHPTNGLQIVQVRTPENSTKKIARLYHPRSTVPNTILTEEKPGSDRFIDDITGEKYQNTKTGMTKV